MSERDQDSKHQYRRVRSDFDELKTEDKVVFLLEATVSTVARGIDEFGRAVSDELNKAFSRRAERKAHEHDSSEDGDASDPHEGPTNGSTGPEHHDESTP